MDLFNHGAQHFPNIISATLSDLIEFSAKIDEGTAGKRLVGHQDIQNLCNIGEIPNIIHRITGHNYKAVRAILFDKNPELNWSLAWHQDRTICVKEQIESDGFGPWTVKQGYQHVEPPFEIIATMLTLRLHLDDVNANNAPLLIAPKTHYLGKIKQSEIDGVIAKHGQYTCTARAGDIWLYSTPILHASKISHGVSRRRVIQIDFSKDTLPNGLEFLGV